jgi:class 3 adenylate cyclase
MSQAALRMSPVALGRLFGPARTTTASGPIAEVRCGGRPCLPAIKSLSLRSQRALIAIMAEERFQRRLTTILASDVVGYSRMMEADEAGTLAALKAWQKDLLEPLVAQHQGRIFKITGDGVLVEFGSAVNAVQCAVDLQHGMAAANDEQPEERTVVGGGAAFCEPLPRLQSWRPPG